MLPRWSTYANSSQNGELGRITNVRAVFFNSYASEPKGALSWRFIRDLAGFGALGDLLSHVVDLVQYLLGPISEVSALTSTVYTERPILPMGSGTHFAVIEDGEMAPVENDDYAAALVRFAPDSRAAGAVGTLEASRVIVGPQCGIGLEIYGTEGSATWNFERMNELRVCLGRGGPHFGYTTVLGNSYLGDYAHFQPGPGTSMGHDDLKVIEAKKFLVAVTGGERRNSTVDDAHHVAEVIAAAAASTERGTWQHVPAVAGCDIRRRPGNPPRRAGEVMIVDRPVVVALGTVDPALVTGVLGDGGRIRRRSKRAGHRRCRRRDRPCRRRCRCRVSRARATVARHRTDRCRRRPRRSVGGRVRGIPVVITPGSGTRAVAEGVFALALHLVKRLGPSPISSGTAGGRIAVRSPWVTWTAPRSASSATDGSGGGSASSPQPSG